MQNLSEIEVGTSHKLVLNLETGAVWLEPRSRVKRGLIRRLISVAEYLIFPDNSDIRQEVSIFSMDHENIRQFLKAAEAIEENYNKNKVLHFKPFLK